VGGAEIRIEAGGDAPHRVSAVGLSPEERAAVESVGRSGYARLFAVFTGDPAPDKPAIAGAYELAADGLHFRPRFPFVSGVKYTARLDLGRAVVLRRFDVAAPIGPAPRVLGVFPSADVLPENLLRLYVHFSQPMEAKDAPRHVSLIDDLGREVPMAFVEIEHGLWDARQTRLTLLLHPGRIKRGVAPGERLGPPLREDRAYRLRVDASLRDAAGRPLGVSFEKRFRVGPADRQSPSRAGLRLEPPNRPDAPLIVQLPEALDEALLHRFVWVEDADGRALEGAVTIAAGETVWSFRPSIAWTPGEYALRVHPALEDRAGNRFDRLFDRDTEASPAPVEPTAHAVHFSFPLP
jgi:hypothetical protein